MTDERNEDSAGKQGQPGSEPATPKSGAGYGDHAPELQKRDEKSA